MIKPLVKIILLCITIFLGGLMTIHAQGPDEGEELGEEPIVVAPSGRLNLTFEQLGYDMKELTRNKSERHYRVDLPGNFQISPTGNYFDLVTHHLPEIPDKPSALKVKVDGRPFYTLFLTGSNAVSNTVHIPLPEGVLQAGSNSIGIDLDTSATCEDPGAIVDAFVDPASTISFGYQQNPYPTDLSLYPFPFTEQTLLEIPVTLVLPDHPTSDVLSAAATVAAGLGQTSGGAIDLRGALASELDPDVRSNHHLIVIGQPGDNALLDDLDLPMLIDDIRLRPGQGVLEEIVSPWNEFRLILVVSGLDDEGVLKASQALNRQAHFLGMRGPVAILTQLRSVPKSIDRREPSMTLASLGYEDQIVYGAQPQDFTYDFALPLGWQLQELPFLVLKFSHADILDPYESAIDISLNDTPIDSALLDESNAVEGELTVSLPRRLLKAGRNQLKIGIEMNFPDASREKCRDLADERAWTVISSESEIFLPYNTIGLPPDLSLFPYPFSQSSGMDQTLLVLPDQPNNLVFSALIQLAVRLGSASATEHISARVAYASEVDKVARKNYHLILLGRPTENALLREVNAYLPQPFAPDSDVLEPLAVDNVAFVPDPERDAGLLQLTDSPWSGRYSLLAITGTTDEGVQLAVQTLLGPNGLRKGNLAVVEPVFLADEPNQVSTYTIDTRPSVATGEETSTDDTTIKDNLVLLAERWWR